MEPHSFGLWIYGFGQIGEMIPRNACLGNTVYEFISCGIPGRPGISRSLEFLPPGSGVVFFRQTTGPEAYLLLAVAGNFFWEV